MKKEAYLYDRYSAGKVICRTCQRRCVIPQGKTGWCRTRVNEAGKLYSLIYGEVSSLSINPIEKKPVYHFFPGSKWFSLGSLGCNFRCPGCQNWRIAHWKSGMMHTEYVSAEDSVAEAKACGCLGISWTFNEPTLWFEYTLDAAKCAKKNGLYTNYVTNGSITAEPFAMLAPFLDVYRVDIKGFSAETYAEIGHIQKPEEIRAIAEMAKERRLHVEVVTNIIPGLNDDEHEVRSIASWIMANLGRDTPWHVTRFYPHHKLQHFSSTPIVTLENARLIGKETGLWYVYLGNVPGHKWENTYCHHCDTLLIERYIFDIIKNRITAGKCHECGTVIPGRF